VNYIPDHLVAPTFGGHLYGELAYDERVNRFVIRGEPAMRELARRLFPGASVTRDHLAFDNTRRAAGELNWFLLRYPLEVKCQSELSAARTKAIEHAQRRTTNSDLSAVVPPSEFTGKLFAYQAVGASFLTANERTLLADGMGLGKTWTSLAAAAHGGKYPVLVVCQTHVQRQWQRAIGSLFDLPCGGQGALVETPWERAVRRGQAMAPILRTLTPYSIPDTPFTIVHYGLLSAWQKTLDERGYPVVIFDEVQELRHSGSLKYSAASLLSSAADCVWGLSGTPIYGYGGEIWNVLNAIDFHCLGSYDAFSREWCAGYGEKVIEKPDVLGDYLRREGLMLRRRQAEVQPDLPPILRRVQDVDHDESLHAELMKTAVAQARGFNQLEWHRRGQTARDIDRASRHAAGVAKAHQVGAFVAGLLEAGERPLVFAWHHDVHDILQTTLSAYSPSVLTGRETEAQKDKALQRFIEGKTDVALMSLRTAAGLDGLQARATCVVMAELDWSPAVHGQCETRAARLGVDGDVKEIPSYYCVAQTGYDMVMMDVLGLKTSQFVGIMGDVPESSEDRKAQDEAVAKRIQMLIQRLSGTESKFEPRGTVEMLENGEVIW
jgi:superfamily II DNA or RNA helicase